MKAAATGKGEAATDAAGARPESPTLVRAIGRWDLVAAVVNGIVGSAVFGLPATLAALTGRWSPLAALAAGLGMLAIVLCFAEVGSRFREAGGPYLYARTAFGPWVGFEIGWLIFWTRVLSAAANLNVFALYLGELVPSARLGAGRLTAMALLWGAVTVLNLVGVRQTTWAVNLFTVAKLLPLLAVVALGLGRIASPTLATQAVEHVDWMQAILLLVFAYGGFETALVPAGEARDPKRDTAFALLVALALVAGLYCLVQWVVVGVVPHAAAERAPIAAVARVLLGPLGATLASLAAMISIYGWATGTLLQSPRVLFAMAEHGELPALFGRVHPRFRTPDVAILLFAAVTLGFAALGSFAANATFAAIVRLVYYALTAAALPLLRRDESEPPGFRLAGAAIVVPLALLFCLALLATRTFEQAWILALLLLAGVPLRWMAVRGARAD